PCWQRSWRDYPRVTDGSTSRNGTVPRAPLPRRPEWLLQSRDLKPLNRYFPELESTILEQLPSRAVVDGEVVIAGEAGLDFEALQLRVHPAASRVKLLSEESPASLARWDLLCEGDEDLRDAPPSTT